MSYANEADMRDHIIRQTRRAGDATFLAEWPRMLDKAEQRMQYGSGEPFPTPRIRLRGMEHTATITFTNGVASLPADYLQSKAMAIAGLPPAIPGYYTPEDFDASLISGGDGRPIIYTIKGNAVHVKPSYSGSANLLYYRALAAATLGQNWLMLNAPGIYETALLYEAYRFLRNPAMAETALREYAAMVNGLMQSDIASKSLGSLRPRVPNARVMR